MHPCFGLLRRLAIPLRSPRFAWGPAPGSSRRGLRYERAASSIELSASCVDSQFPVDPTLRVGPAPGGSRRTPWPRGGHGLNLRCSRSRVAIPGDLNMQRKASARWQGTLKQGHGSISPQSGALIDAPYGFNTRFADGKGTNPEE